MLNNPVDILRQLVLEPSMDLLEAEARLELLERSRKQHRTAAYFEPHPDQQQLWSVIRPGVDTYLILGGNGSGKSILLEWLLAVCVLGKEFFHRESNWSQVEPLPFHHTPTNVRLVGLTTKRLRDPLWRELFTGANDRGPMIPPDLVAAKNDNEFTCRLHNGSHIEGLSADTDPKTHGGSSLDAVFIDEEIGYEHFHENHQRIRRGGKVFVSATPLDDVGTANRPWIYELIEQWRRGDPTVAVIFLKTLNNPYLSDEWKRIQVARLRGLPDEKARLEGVPTRRSGLYYPQWHPEPPLWVPVRPLDPRSLRAVMIDPAVTGTVGALWAAFDSRGKMTLYRCYKRRGLTVSGHVENILVENRGDPIRLWLCDPFMGRQRIPDPSSIDEHHTVAQVWREAGLSRLKCADLGDYELALARSHEYLTAAADSTSPHPGMEVFDHLTEFRDEIESYIIDVVAQGVRRGELRDRPRKGRDGASTLMECFQYLCGLRLRARADDQRALTATPPDPSTHNYFAPVGVNPNEPLRGW